MCPWHPCTHRVCAKGIEVQAFLDCCWSRLSVAVPAWHSTQLHPAPGQQPQDSGDVAHPAWWASWAAHSPLPAMQEGEQGHSGNHPQSGSSMEQMAEQTVLGFLFHIIFCPVHSHA